MSKDNPPRTKRPTPQRTGPRRGPEGLFQGGPADEDLVFEGRDSYDEEDLDDEDLDDEDYPGDEEDLDDEDEADDSDEARLSMESARQVADKHDPYRTRPEDMRRGYDHFRSAGHTRRKRRRSADILEVAGAGTAALTRLLTLWIDLLGPLLPPALGLGRGRRRRLSRGLDERRRDDRYEEREPARGNADEMAICLDVTSPRPVEVSLELDRGILPGPLKVQPLRATSSRTHAIRGAMVDIDGTDRVFVKLHVPNDVPSGLYEGAVISAQGRARLGLLRVTVRDGGPAHSV